MCSDFEFAKRSAFKFLVLFLLATTFSFAGGTFAEVSYAEKTYAKETYAEITYAEQTFAEKVFASSGLDFRDKHVEKLTVKELKDRYEDKYSIDWGTVATKFGVGSAIIVITGTVGVVAGAVGAEPVAVIAFASCKGAVSGAITGAAVGGGLGGLIGDLKDGNLDAAKKGVIEGAADGFMWGAAIGAITGGVAGYKELKAMKNAVAEANVISKTASNAETVGSQSSKILTNANHLAISQATTWPMFVVEKIITKEQFEILRKANLEYKVVNGRPSLCKKNLNLDFIAEKTKTAKSPNGRTNRDLIKNGQAPYDPITGEKIQLHHLNQEFNGPLVELTPTEHAYRPNHGILHPKTNESWRKVPGKEDEFAKQRRDHWLERGSKF